LPPTVSACRLAKTACKFPTCVILFMRLPQLFHRVSLSFADTLYMPRAPLVSRISQILLTCIHTVLLAHCIVFDCSCKLLSTRVLFSVRCGLNSLPGLFMPFLNLKNFFFLLINYCSHSFEGVVVIATDVVARCMYAHYARLQ